MEALKNIAGEKTEFGPGKTALYYNNVGLFSDPFLEDRLPNLEEYYKNPSTRFLNEYWNIDESDASKYNKALQDILDLWNDLDQDIPSYCANERQLQNSWIDKIFAILGWTIELEESSSKHGITNFPDYALFASHDDWKKSKTLSGNHKFKKATAVADAKGWGINLDGKGFSNKNPSYQIINYLKQTDKNWGVLTDGKYWRIYSLRSESKHTTYYEIDLEKILSAMDKEDGYERFKYFYNFFRVEAFVNDARLSDRSFLDFVFDDGKFYSQRVENNLQERVYKVVDSICKGFLETYTNPTEQELKEVYEYSMYYLFKLMFVLNCESKGLLEVNKQDDYYDFSLRKMCMDIKEQFEAGKTWSGQPKTYNHINDLFTLLKAGDSKIGVHGFGEEPFEIGSEEFYSKHKISDEHLNHALLELSCDYDEEDNLQFIDYKILSPDHIGSLFEGLLEFNLVKKGKKVELLNTKGDRKATGSYYTPEYMVDYIVEETLQDVVGKKLPQEILDLKIIDPAMGSGHFLLGAVKYLEKRIIEIQDDTPQCPNAIDFDKIRKSILHKCIFGIDINTLATQLAKFSLWIYTCQKGDYLEPLKDQLISGDTLSDDFLINYDFQGQLGFGEADAVIGNPPYLGESDNKEIFQKIRSGKFGQKYYTRNIDLLYFFYHRGLQLLKENGKLGFVTTNYFFTADGAIKLRAELREKANILKLINFNNLKIFKNAQGQHNAVVFFTKSKPASSVKIIDVNMKGQCDRDKLLKIVTKSSDLALHLTVKNNKLWNGEHNYLSYNRSISGNIEMFDQIFDKMITKSTSLKELFKVNQGIVTGMSKFTKKLADTNPEIKSEAGSGVLVLSSDEVKKIGLNGEERKLLKKWFKNSDIYKFGCVQETDEYLILSNFIKDFSKYPNLKKHFNKYKEPLEARSQMEHCLDWWDLHQIRMKDKQKSGEIKKMLFDKEKIVIPYRSKSNTFGYSNREWYSGNDTYIITSQNNSPYSIKVLLGLLNSSIYYFWLYNKGKRKGDMLELFNTPLNQIPLPKTINKDTLKKIEARVNKIVSNSEKVKTYFDSELDDIIFNIFNLSHQEASVVKNFIREHLNIDQKVKQAA